MTRHPGDPLYEMNDGRNPWQGAGKLIVAMVVVVGLVLVVVYGGVPLGSVEGPNNRQARKLLRDAQVWERESLYNTAAEQYQKVSDNPKIKRELRLEAAERLAVLQRDQLNNPKAAETALEKAFHFAQGEHREELRQQLEALRGRPVERTPATERASAQAGSSHKTSGSGSGTGVASGPMVENEIARVGGRSITVEDVLFAWARLNGQRPPTQVELEPFVNQYLDMALLSAEAERRGVDAQGRAALDLKLNRMLALNTAMSQVLIEELQTPPAEELRAFYEQNPALYAGPPILTVLPLLVRDEARARQVAGAIRNGDEFEALAERFGMGGPGLNVGETYRVNAADPTFRPLNDNSGLPARLARLDEGQTTGPWVTARGLAFFKLVEKEGGNAPPFEQVQDDVLMAYQRNMLARKRQELLTTLRQNVPIEFNDAGMGHLSGETTETTTSANPSAAATTGTTASPNTASTTETTPTLDAPAEP